MSSHLSGSIISIFRISQLEGNMQVQFLIKGSIRYTAPYQLKKEIEKTHQKTMPTLIDEFLLDLLNGFPISDQRLHCSIRKFTQHLSVVDCIHSQFCNRLCYLASLLDRKEHVIGRDQAKVIRKIIENAVCQLQQKIVAELEESIEFPTQ